MPYVVACLDMDLQEFVDWIVNNIQPGFEPRFLNASSSELWQTLPHADFLVLFESKITAEMVAAASKLRLIQLPQVGYDNVDVAAATKAGVPVCNISGVTAGSVAEHTLGMMLGLAKDFERQTAFTRDADWSVRETHRGFDLDDRTLLIVGHGRIGNRVAALARAFTR